MRIIIDTEEKTIFHDAKTVIDYEFLMNLIKNTIPSGEWNLKIITK